MGICFTYESTTQISKDVNDEVIKLASQLSDRAWSTTEGMLFFDFEPNKVSGSTKLHMDEENISEEHDIAFIIRHLCEWSTKLGFDWQISVEEEPVGQIVKGSPDDGVTEFVEMMSNMG